MTTTGFQSVTASHALSTATGAGPYRDCARHRRSLQTNDNDLSSLIISTRMLYRTFLYQIWRARNTADDHAIPLFFKIIFGSSTSRSSSWYHPLFLMTSKPSQGLDSRDSDSSEFHGGGARFETPATISVDKNSLRPRNGNLVWFLYGFSSSVIILRGLLSPLSAPAYYRQ